MLSPGDTVETISGERLKLMGLLGDGGEGSAFKVRRAGGELGVLKTFKDKAARRERLRRTRFLISQHLDRTCSAIAAPTELVDTREAYGHVSALAAGIDLEALFQDAAPPLVATVQVALAVAHAVDALHEGGIAHGDLHLRNIKVRHQGDAWHVKLIDLDGFAAPGFPSPVAGALLYMAPEVNEAVLANRPVSINETSDRFSLAILLHELLIWAHVSCAGRNEEETREAMYGGKWAFDPVYGHAPAGIGLPPTALNAELQGLFRRAMSSQPAGRPSPAEWRDALQRAFWSVWQCPRCGGFIIVDSSKRICPYPGCRQPYPRLALTLAAGGQVSLDDAATVVGRALLGGRESVSSKHAIIRRQGPEYWIEDRGRYGTWRSDWRGGWIRLPFGRPVLLRPGDVVKFASVEARFVAVA